MTVVKISDTLAEDARAASVGTDRSLAGQIEYWAGLGKAVEPLFTAPTIDALKKSGGNLDLIGNPAQRQEVINVLTRLRLHTPFEETAAFLSKTRGALFEADSTNPDGIVQVIADGTRVPGKFVNREFGHLM